MFIYLVPNNEDAYILYGVYLSITSPAVYEFNVLHGTVLKQLYKQKIYT